MHFEEGELELQDTPLRRWLRCGGRLFNELEQWWRLRSPPSRFSMEATARDGGENEEGRRFLKVEEIGRKR